jgi:ribose-phosphate pyrophosphokinase
MFNIHSPNGRALPYKSFTFSGGEVQVKFEPFSPFITTAVTISAHITSSDLIMELVLVVDALRRTFGQDLNINLVCPYLPYARQDRLMTSGESLSLKVMCDIINSLQFSSVEVWDVHSDVSLALLDNVRNYGPETFLQCIPIDKKNTILVAPDAGSMKKVGKVAQQFGMPMVRADKVRSVVDGSITGTVVYSEHIGTKDFLIVDDICDGGRTFTELAKVLKPLTDGKIYLYVTHGIFSKGLEVFGDIDHLYTAKAFPHVDLNFENITQLNMVGH